MPSDRPKKPHGTFTPASKISAALTRAGYGRASIRKHEAFGGHRCSWNKDRKQVMVGYQCPDSTPVDQQDTEHAEMLNLYAEVLTGKGYRVERTDRFLYVNPVKETSMPDPKPTTAEQIKALAWLRKGWDGDNSERAIKAFTTLDKAGLFAALDRERDAQQPTQEDRTP